MLLSLKAATFSIFKLIFENIRGKMRHSFHTSCKAGNVSAQNEQKKKCEETMALCLIIVYKVSSSACLQ